MQAWLLLTVLASGLTLDTGSPVEKVVTLLTDLKNKINVDSDNEQKIYDKFACWCEKTTQRTADGIDAGKATIAATTNEILTLKGAIAVLTTEINELNDKIAAAEKAIKTATTIREKENSDYQQEKANSETAINSLHQAINVLSGAGTGGDSDRTMMLLSAASKVRSAVLNTQAMNALSEKSASILKSFLEAPGDKDEFYKQKARARASYSPQSATVTGILKDMYDTFASSLQKSNQEESNAQKAFEDIVAGLESEIKMHQESVAKKEVEKADNQESLSDNEEALASAQEQLAADEALFISARDQCKEKSDDWDERGRLRTEELKGIDEALKILTSDAAREMFAKSKNTRAVDTFGSAGVDVSFVQMENSPREKAYRSLKLAVKQTKSLRLARLAAAVRSTATGHFDSVIGAIDDMIKTLKAEERDDIDQRDFCIKDRNAQRNKRDDQIYDLKQLNAAKTRAEEKKARLEDERTATEEAKANLKQDLADALNDRQDQNTAFHDAKNDDEAAIDLLEQAMSALSKYGDNNALIQQPVFEVSEDQAPDAELSGKDKYANASNGIVSLLANIQNDLKNEVDLAKKAESKAQAEFDQYESDCNAQVERYNQQITALDTSISNTDGDIASLTNEISDLETEKEATLDYLSKVKPNCDWVEGAFEKRAAARKAESEALEQAKSILAGSEGGDFGFLQRVQ